MHSRLTTRALVAAAAVAVALALCVPIVVVAVAGPSAAQGRGPGGSCAQCQGAVTPVDEGFLARVRSDSTTLNSAAANPQACMGIGRDPRLDENNNPIPEPGILRWRTTALGRSPGTSCRRARKRGPGTAWSAGTRAGSSREASATWSTSASSRSPHPPWPPSPSTTPWPGSASTT